MNIVQSEALNVHPIVQAMYDKSESVVARQAGWVAELSARDPELASAVWMELANRSKVLIDAAIEYALMAKPSDQQYDSALVLPSPGPIPPTA